jgi:hypothetical protein
MALLAGQRITQQRLTDSMQRVIEYAPITANTGTTTTTEAIAITSAALTFRTGRAYRIALRGLAQSSAGGDTMTLKVRKTNTSGTVYLESFRLYIPVNGTNVDYYSSQICTNTTGADVSAPLVATYLRNSGGGNVLVAASATHVSYIRVEDIGLASDFPSAVAIT